MRVGHGVVAALMVMGVVGVPASPADATTPASIYVNNLRGSSCSDKGSGTVTAPFCTISAAAAAAQPGQTVYVGPGDYPQQVDISAKGSADAPIMFIGQSTYRNPMSTLVGVGSGWPAPAHAFLLDGAQNVVIQNFQIGASAGGVMITNSQNITIDQIYDGEYSTNGPSLQVTGSSKSVTLRRSVLSFGVELESGVTGTTITTNVLHNASSGNPAIQGIGAPGTVIVSNTITACAAGIDLAGGSSGSTIRNNVLGDAAVGSTTCAQSPSAVGITVAADAVASTTSDYNVVHVASGAAPYSWAGTAYPDQPSFTASTGQGGHDSTADPRLTGVTVPIMSQSTASGFGYPSEGTPEIDSADQSAPDELTTDVFGMPRVDDPLVTNTGTGTRYYDRGAFEFQDPIEFTLATLATRTMGSAPQQITFTPGISSPWSQDKVTYTYDFQDGTPGLVTTSSTITHTFPLAGRQTVIVSATDGYGKTQPTDPGGRIQVAVGADYTPLTPVRILDTRKAIGVASTTPVAPNSTVVLAVTGAAGVPGTGVSAVTMNVTAVGATASGYLTVYADGSPRPVAANLNFASSAAVPNLVTVPVVNGRVAFYNSSAGTVHVLADLEGFYSDAGYDFHPSAPDRVLDTRVPTGTAVKAPVGPNGHLQLDLTSNPHLMPDTHAVILNVTVTGPSAGGYLTVYPDGAAQPTASNLNFSAGQTIANQVTVALIDGKIDLYNGSGGTVNVIADLNGYYAPQTANGAFSYLPINSVRIEDTRAGANPAPLAAFDTTDLGVAIDMNGAPPGNAEALMLNVTAIAPGTGGYLTVYPDGQPRPVASSLNFSTGQTVSNLVAMVTGKYAGIDIYNGSGAPTNLAVDIQGYFLNP